MIRAKTKRRLIILLAVVIAGPLALVGAYGVRREYLRAQALHARDRAEAAAKIKDYDTVLRELDRYLSRFPNDKDAIYTYALARQNVEEADGRQVAQAAALWRRFLELSPQKTDPKYLEANRQLLDLYLKLGFSTETLEASNYVLSRIPDDPAALRAKAIALVRLRRFPDALAVIQRCNQLQPENFDNQLLELSVQSSNGATSEQLIAATDALAKAHPNDSQFELLQSIARASAGNHSSAIAAVRDAAAHFPSNPQATPEIVSVLVKQLDVLELYSEAIATAEKVAQKHADDPAYQRIFVSRLLIAGDYAKLDTILNNTLVANAATDPQLLALKGVSLIQRHRLPEAATCFDAITKQPRNNPDRVASAIAASARAAAIDVADPKASIEICRTALQADAANPLLHYFLADAYTLHRDLESAVREWQAASKIAPAWGLPLSRIARALLGARRNQDALAEAREAQKRAPDDVETLVTIAAAWSASINPKDTAESAKLLAFLRETHARFPAAEQIRPILIDLLLSLGAARRGDEGIPSRPRVLAPAF